MTRHIRQIISFHIAAVITVAAGCLFFAAHQAIGCLFAGLLIGTNLAIVAWVLKKIFQKKSIALVVGVIVIKYAVLLGLFYLLYAFGWKANFGFVLGLSTLFLTLGYIAYKHNRYSEINGSL